MSRTLHACFMVSGGGTTMAAILKAISDDELKGVVPELIIASKPAIGAIKKALDARIACHRILVLSPKNYPNPKIFARRINEECKIRGVNFISQNGWLPLTPPEVLREFPGMMINQHPGPLDPLRPGLDFGGKGMYGRRVIAARLYFVQMTGHDWWTEAVSHRVTPEFDRGVVIRSERVDIWHDDTVETLQGRLLPVEHRVQIAALGDFVNDCVREVQRFNALAFPHEHEALAEAKRRAIADYPNG